MSFKIDEYLVRALARHEARDSAFSKSRAKVREELWVQFWTREQFEEVLTEMRSIYHVRLSSGKMEGGVDDSWVSAVLADPEGTYPDAQNVVEIEIRRVVEAIAIRASVMPDVASQFTRALAWLTQAHPACIGLGLRVYSSNGGDLKRLIPHIKADIKYDGLNWNGAVSAVLNSHIRPWVKMEGVEGSLIFALVDGKAMAYCHQHVFAQVEVHQVSQTWLREMIMRWMIWSVEPV